MRLATVLAALAATLTATLAACGTAEHSAAPAELSAVEPTPTPALTPNRSNVERLAAVAVADDAAPTPLTRSQVSVPLEVVDGTFLGIGVGSFLSEALSVLGVAAVVEHAGASEALPGATTSLSPCSTAPVDHWVMSTNGLTLLFEGSSAEQARLTNWVYVGGPASGFTEMVAPKGITIGRSRGDVMATYKHAEDFGDVIDVSEPVHLWFGLNGDSVAWFGDSDCGI